MRQEVEQINEKYKKTNGNSRTEKSTMDEKF